MANCWKFFFFRRAVMQLTRLNNWIRTRWSRSGKIIFFPGHWLSINGEGKTSDDYPSSNKSVDVCIRVTDRYRLDSQNLNLITPVLVKYCTNQPAVLSAKVAQLFLLFSTFIVIVVLLILTNMIFLLLYLVQLLLLLLLLTNKRNGTIPAFGHESHDFQISRSYWAGVVLYFYSPVKGEVDKRTFNCGFSIDCISTCTPTYLYISTEGGGIQRGWYD